MSFGGPPWLGTFHQKVSPYEDNLPCVEETKMTRTKMKIFIVNILQ